MNIKQFLARLWGCLHPFDSRRWAEQGGVFGIVCTKCGRRLP